MKSFDEYFELQEQQLSEASGTQEKYIAAIDKVKAGSNMETLKLPKGFSLKIMKNGKAQKTILFDRSKEVSSIYLDYDMGNQFELADINSSSEYKYIQYFEDMDDLAMRINKGK
ncbi:hypothetical protein GD1_10 [Paraglaciecola Antarctic GD virus 1]|nr:hypothetical protein GD1_10 [Paraglaciecola Antarctic GD virus 1]